MVHNRDTPRATSIHGNLGAVRAYTESLGVPEELGGHLGCYGTAGGKLQHIIKLRVEELEAMVLRRSQSPMNIHVFG